MVSSTAVSIWSTDTNLWCILFADESLPPSPQKQTSTVVIPDKLDNLPIPEANNALTTDPSLCLEIDLESQHARADLDNSTVVPDEELDSYKARNGTDSAIGDVYSNGNSSTITLKETDVSSLSAELKPSDQISLEKQDTHADCDRNELTTECSNENILSIDQQDNLSSSPSWNLDSIRQTPEPDFGSFPPPEPDFDSFQPLESDFESLPPPCDLDSLDASCQLSTESEHIKLEQQTVFPPDMNTEDPLPAQVENTIAVPDSNDISCDKFDDDDTHFNADFGDFATFDDANLVQENASPQTNPTDEGSRQCDNSQNMPTEFDEDDEFGEFSDFQQTAVVAPVAPAATETTSKDETKTLNVLLVSENISSVLTIIFPNDDNCDESSGYRQNTEAYSKGSLSNDLTVQLQNVENSNALTHQWAKSISKSVLVKALGIDSRNIVSVALDHFEETTNRCSFVSVVWRKME